MAMVSESATLGWLMSSSQALPGKAIQGRRHYFFPRCKLDMVFVISEYVIEKKEIKKNSRERIWTGHICSGRRVQSMTQHSLLSWEISFELRLSASTKLWFSCFVKQRGVLTSYRWHPLSFILVVYLSWRLDFLCLLNTFLILCTTSPLELASECNAHALKIGDS